jgi:type I restriction enzyme R subunit
MKGKLYESDYEEALIILLKEQGWEYTHGRDIARNNREVLLINDLTFYLQKRYVNLNDNDGWTFSEIADVIELDTEMKS